MYYLLLTVILSGTNPDPADMNQEYGGITLTYFLSDTIEFPFKKITPDTNIVEMPVYKPLLLDSGMPVFKPPGDIEFNMPVIGRKDEKSQESFFHFPDSTENPLKKRPSGIDRND